VEVIARAFGDETRIEVYLAAGERYDLVLRGAAGWAHPPPHTLAPGDFDPAGHLAGRAACHIIADLGAGGAPVPERLKEEGLRSAVMMKIDGITGSIGYLSVYSPDPSRFARADASFLELTAGSLVAAVDRDVALERLRSAAVGLQESVLLRRSHLRLLNEVAWISNRASTIESALPRVLTLMGELLEWPLGHAFIARSRRSLELVDSKRWRMADRKRYRPFLESSRGMTVRPGEGIAGHVAAAGRPVWLKDFASRSDFRRGDAARRSGLRTGLIVPIVLHSRTVGILEFYSGGHADPVEKQIEISGQIGAQLGQLVDRGWLQKEWMGAQSEEQRRIAAELHDTVRQDLVGISMLAQSLRMKLLASGLESEAEVAGRIVSGGTVAGDQLRAVVKGLNPVEVDAGGLEHALGGLADTVRDRYSVDCRLEAEGMIEVADNDVATHAYRIAHQAVNNALQHGGAQSIRIALRETEEWVELEVRDDGSGFDTDAVDESPGMGLRIMRHRADIIDAELTFRSTPGGGTTVRCAIPKE
jgi:signal transduction histidine kinase